MAFAAALLVAVELPAARQSSGPLQGIQGEEVVNDEHGAAGWALSAIPPPGLLRTSCTVVPTSCLPVLTLSLTSPSHATHGCDGWLLLIAAGASCRCLWTSWVRVAG